MKNSILHRLFAVLFVLLALSPAVRAETFEVADRVFLLDGRPFVIKAAELHYPRIPRPYWEHRIQMCKALGMNTICMYVFWNLHEPTEGLFDFDGQNDIAAFVRLAAAHDMKVIVRPGPYVCAEWEMGGLPWWLLRKSAVRLRENDPYFIERVRLFEREVARRLAPLTIENGGPIIMVQVENEYGSYGVDKEYVAAIRDILREVGFDKTTLFQCDWSSNFTANGLDDLLWTLNFGTWADVDEQFAPLRALRPLTPLMCSEYWSGWFDKWGAAHETRSAADMVAGIEAMLDRGISFSLYMTHGGTSFGHWAGANSPGYAPDVTSYDYDAPIDERGAATPKYNLLRQSLLRYVEDSVPEPPAPIPVIEIPEFQLTDYAPLGAGVVCTVHSDSILTMEEVGQGWGLVQYRTALPAAEEGGILIISDVHDYARVYLGDRHLGDLNRIAGDSCIALPAVGRGDSLTILVEAMGRINFGRAIKDYKGITDHVTLGGHDLTNWDIDLIPDDYANAARALGQGGGGRGPGYYRGIFSLDSVGDSYLDMSQWGKGQAYINGHALGRFWNIGPQQTLYMPGCWLCEGPNEIVVYDILGPARPVMRGLRTPVLDQLKAGDTPSRQNPRPDLEAFIPAAHDVLQTAWQTVTFEQPQRGRYLAVAFEGGERPQLAEIYAMDADGHRLDRQNWSVYYVDSQDLESGNHGADKIIDLQESTWWQPTESAPQIIVLDLGASVQIGAVAHLGRTAGNPFHLYIW